MTEYGGQWYCMKFCKKLGNIQNETIHKIQQAFGNDVMGVTQIKGNKVTNYFKSGQTSVIRNQCTGRVSTSQNLYAINRLHS